MVPSGRRPSHAARTLGSSQPAFSAAATIIRPTLTDKQPPSMFALMRAVIARVPRGKVVTYGQVAEAAGFQGAARQAAWALHDSRGLPWHRVVAAGGRIALPGENGLDQRLRLEVEGVTFRGGKVRMDLHGWMRAKKPTSRAPSESPARPADPSPRSPRRSDAGRRRSARA
jgi:methylated-DNA-protein-cysteine methyltransferase-like protein